MIYNTLSGELVKYASALVGPDEGPDLLSAVITRILAKRRLSDLDDPRRYLFRAVSNEAKNHRRRVGQRQVIRIDPRMPMPESSVDQTIDAVMDLPVQQRAATYLVYWLEFTPTEAAQVLGCRPGTVRRYLHLARSKLKEVLDAPQ